MEAFVVGSWMVHVWTVDARLLAMTVQGRIRPGAIRGTHAVKIETGTQKVFSVMSAERHRRHADVR